MSEFRKPDSPPASRFNEIVIPSSVFDIWSQVSSSREMESVLESLVMGRSVLELLDLDSSLEEFSSDHLNLSLGQERLPVQRSFRFYNFDIWATHLNIINTLCINFKSHDSDEVLTVGVGLVNLEQIGGFVTLHHHMEDQKNVTQQVEQVMKFGIDLSVSPDNSISLDDTSLDLLRGYSLLSLEDAWEEHKRVGDPDFPIIA